MSSNSTPSASPEAGAPNPGRSRKPAIRAALFLGLIAATVAAIWFGYGRKVWKDYQDLQREIGASEDAAPVGYLGLNYRRGYNDRPLTFQAEKDGRKLLFAAKGPDGKPEYYDVTDSNLDPRQLDGGYGRDSIPGVDFPIIEAADSSRAKSLIARHQVFGVLLNTGPRAYPKTLIEKIEVVNDLDGSTPFVAVYDRSRGKTLLLERRLNDAVVTFGTTGYSLDKRPLLYDRKSKSLWLPEGEDLACVSGASKGAKVKPYLSSEATRWSEWSGKYPRTTVLFGNDRKKPIPEE